VGPLKNGGLKLDLGSFKTSNFFSTMGVPIKYQDLNGEDLTIVDALINCNLNKKEVRIGIYTSVLTKCN
jgi:hypothetical protein